MIFRYWIPTYVGMTTKRRLLFRINTVALRILYSHFRENDDVRILYLIHNKNFRRHMPSESL